MIDQDIPPDGMAEIERNESLLVLIHVVSVVALTGLFFPDVLRFVVSHLSEFNILGIFLAINVYAGLFVNIMILMFLIMFLHEWIHVYAFLRYEYIPCFQTARLWVFPMAVVSPWGERISREHFVRAALAPVVLITLVAIPFLHPSLPLVIQIYAAVIVITSVGLATSDVHDAWKAYKSPSDAEFIEILDGDKDRLFVSKSS